MILNQIEELELYPVVDRGIPNLERIPILIKRSVNVAQYGLMLGETKHDGIAIPLRDYLYWFGDGILNVGDWIILYTGSGDNKIESWHTPPNSKVYTVHWGRETTLFATSAIVPLLFQMSSVTVGRSPENQPQLKRVTT